MRQKEVYYTMLRITFTLMSLFAVVGVSAIASASASAIGRIGACETVSVAGSGQWGNSECTSLGGSKEWSTKEITSGTLKGTGGEAVLTSEVGGAEVNVICAKGKTTATIEASGKAGSGEATFEECTTGNSKERFGSCEVPTITVKFTSQLIEEESELRAEFKPNGPEVEGEKTFTEVVINNKGEKVCTIKGKYPVTGFAIALIPNANILKITHLLDFSLADNHHLLFKKKAATLTTSFNVNVLRGTGSGSRYVPFDFLR